MKVYRAGRRGSAFSQWSDYPEARKVYQEKLVGKGPFKWKVKDAEHWSDEADFPKVLRNLDRLQPSFTETDAFWTKILDTGSIFVLDVGELHITIPDPPPGVSQSIAKAHRLVFRTCEELDLEDPDELRIITMGYTVCKWINSIRGGTPSQHCPGPPSPTGGNAFDWVVRRRDGSVDIAATDKIVTKLGNNGFPEVLWRGVADHYPNHVHVSGSPKRSGTPSCL
jgi:hypothetical protein